MNANKLLVNLLYDSWQPMMEAVLSHFIVGGTKVKRLWRFFSGEGQELIPESHESRQSVSSDYTWLSLVRIKATCVYNAFLQGSFHSITYNLLLLLQMRTVRHRCQMSKDKHWYLESRDSKFCFLTSKPSVFLKNLNLNLFWMEGSDD